MPTSARPNIMVGVPVGYLSPRLPFPPNADYNCSVGVEIAPGLGVSLDGKALLVGAEGHQGKTDVLGRLEDGTYPQRDTVVLRSGDQTDVDGADTWRDFSLKGKARDFLAAGDSDRQNFTVKETENGLRVGSQFAGRAWTVENTADGVRRRRRAWKAFSSVRSDFAEGESFHVSVKDGVTTVDSSLPEQDFTVQRTESGAVIDGHYAFDDFQLSHTDDGYEFKGHYPQQKFLISYS
ncbi:MAG TPA: hypothetical protein EYO33_05790 [Phycisphaerales bacterium]|nr:hypothetical protein [Phycisphaerales bacterium]